MVETLRVAILGATGLVGQRFVSILSHHPWFSLEALYSSPEKAGARYGDVVEWAIDDRPDSWIWRVKLRKLDPEAVAGEKFDVVFSALPSEVASKVEPVMARMGVRIVSNASNLRMDPDVPLLNPEVNAEHASIAETQIASRGWRGWVAKVPNCTTAILTLALKPLHDEYGVKRVLVATMQAVSGAGLRGVSAVQITDNIIPYIRGEEEKVERESRKILGGLEEGKITLSPIQVSATTTRVPVLDGHLEAVFAELEEEPGSRGEVERVLEEFRGNKLRGLNLPSAPERPIVVRREHDRPQPRLDRMEGGGMSVVVGRVRLDPVAGGVKMVVLGHNTIRGAAGNGVLIAELMHRLGYL
ncbi:MAG: aspartate-semialdehyde dehydrogenase [Desulfurococcales archaeon]|nr:aspartate-semialdehyde dehydrogenase [Desulfurococcales archaeon]